MDRTPGGCTGDAARVGMRFGINSFLLIPESLKRIANLKQRSAGLQRASEYLSLSHRGKQIPGTFAEDASGLGMKVRWW